MEEMRLQRRTPVRESDHARQVSVAVGGRRSPFDIGDLLTKPAWTGAISVGPSGLGHRVAPPTRAPGYHLPPLRDSWPR